MDASDAADDRDDEDDPFHCGEDVLVLFPPRPEVEQRAGCVEGGGQQYKLHAAGIEHERGRDRRESSDDQIARLLLWPPVVCLAAVGDQESVRRCEYRKIKQPFPPTVRTHPVAHPALPGTTSRRVSTRKLATKSGAV